MNKTSSFPEIEAFLQQHPDIQGVDLLIADLNGIFRGKRVTRDALAHVYADGILLSKSIFASDITGATSEAAATGLQTGDMDCRCLPVTGTLCRTPWKKRPMGQLQMAMSLGDGTPYAADPQAILDNVVKGFDALGLTPVVAIELEFYLIDPRLTPDNAPQQAVSPATGKRQTKTQVYSISDLDDYSDVIDGMVDAARVQNLPADVAVAEYAPGQFEINLHHQPDAQRACRDGLMLKRLIKGVAQNCGFEATFMPKPFADLAGSGCHVHVSLIDDRGNNVFARDPFPNDLLRHAIGGLIHSMPQMLLLYAPGANSYRRFVQEFYVPLSRTWGYNNRTVAVRIPSGARHATRIEHRVAGADANPYLLTASILAGMYHGITHKLEPPPRTTGNAYAQPRDTSLARNWQQSLAAFAAGDIIAQYLGAEFHRVYGAIKQQEYEMFETRITPLEYDWYLRNS